jgi:hypothetical protein
MDALGTIKPVVSQPAPVRTTPVLRSASTSDSLPSIQLGGNNSGDSAPTGMEMQANERLRIEALMRAAQAAPQPLGSQVFTIFKDSSGQYITQFRDTNTGEVTSIPEPQMLALSAGSSAPALLNIKV